MDVILATIFSNLNQQDHWRTNVKRRYKSEERNRPWNFCTGSMADPRTEPRRQNRNAPPVEICTRPYDGVPVGDIGVLFNLFVLQLSPTDQPTILKSPSGEKSLLRSQLHFLGGHVTATTAVPSNTLRRRPKGQALARRQPWELRHLPCIVPVSVDPFCRHQHSKA